MQVNQVALKAPWQVAKSWPFKPSPFSVSLSPSQKTQRTSILVDSIVVRCAVSKGRAASRGLMPVIAKINTTVLVLSILPYSSEPFGRPNSMYQP